MGGRGGQGGQWPAASMPYRIPPYRGLAFPTTAFESKQATPRTAEVEAEYVAGQLLKTTGIVNGTARQSFGEETKH